MTPLARARSAEPPAFRWFIAAAKVLTACAVGLLVHWLVVEWKVSSNLGAFLIGGIISAVWWSNSSAKREQFAGAGAVYAFGAAVGTVVGMWLGR